VNATEIQFLEPRSQSQPQAAAAEPVETAVAAAPVVGAGGLVTYAAHSPPTTAKTTPEITNVFINSATWPGCDVAAKAGTWFKALL